MAEQQRWPSPLRLSAAGIEFIGTFGLLLAGGYLLDRWLHLLPVFTVWGGVVGFGLALRNLLKQAKQVRQYRRGDERDAENQHGDGRGAGDAD
jgi:F0F1-type ATP synthase assembly protein I